MMTLNTLYTNFSYHSIQNGDKINFYFSEAVANLAGVKLDVSNTKQLQLRENVEHIPVVPPHPASASTETRTPSAKTRATSASIPAVKTPATLKTFEMPLQPLVCINWINCSFVGLKIEENFKF